MVKHYFFSKWNSFGALSQEEWRNHSVSWRIQISMRSVGSTDHWIHLREWPIFLQCFCIELSRSTRDRLLHDRRCLSPKSDLENGQSSVVTWEVVRLRGWNAFFAYFVIIGHSSSPNNARILTSALCLWLPWGVRRAMASHLGILEIIPVIFIFHRCTLL